MKLKKEDIQIIVIIAVAIFLLMILAVFFYPRELRVGKAIEGCIIDQNTTFCDDTPTVITLDPFLPSIITENINSTLTAYFSNEDGFFGNKTIGIDDIGSNYKLIFTEENRIEYLLFLTLPAGLNVTSATFDLTGEGYTAGGTRNLSFYVGDINISRSHGQKSYLVWQYEGDFTGITITTPDFSEDLNNYLSTCGWCRVTLVFSSSSSGVVELSNVKIMVPKQNLCQVCIAADGNCDTEWSDTIYTIYTDEFSGKCFYHWDTKKYNYSNYEVGLRIKDTSGIMSTASKHILLTTIEANTPTEFNFTSAADSNLTLFLHENLSSIITVVSKNLTSSPSNLNTLKAIDIEVDDNTKPSLLWSLIKIFYDDAELTAANIDESTLKMYYYNESAAEWQLLPDQGVDTENNYVWANVTHSSTYGVFGNSPSSISSVDNSSSGDGESSGGGGGGGSSTTKTTAQTYTASQEQISIGVIKELKQKDKIEFILLETKHLLEVNTISKTQIVITVSSEPQQKRIFLGGEALFDLGEHDLLVRYLSYDESTKKAKIIMKEIKPLAKPVSTPIEEAVIEAPETIAQEEVVEVMPEENIPKAYFLVVAALVLVCAGIAAFVMKKKKGKKRRR